MKRKYVKLVSVALAMMMIVSVIAVPVAMAAEAVEETPIYYCERCYAPGVFEIYIGLYELNGTYYVQYRYECIYNGGCGWYVNHYYTLY